MFKWWSFDEGFQYYTYSSHFQKIESYYQVAGFRPISLCNVIYVIIANSLANRFKYVLEATISEKQSAFMPGRMITDNAIIGLKCIHSLRKRLKGRYGHLAFKLDMSKAYDCVE
ncbi:hypothetical protein ACOSP7_014342 [Xanthoceras sorbifolium]